MNIEQLISQIKLRPGMYVGSLELEPIVYFINGFLYNNIISDRADNIDVAFKQQFHDWVKMRLENKHNIDLEAHHNYLFYINEVYQNSEEGLKVLFELSNDFFREIHSKTE
ncbi:MAG: hypothetical protein KHZ58_12270 [Hungatella hathewayi]|nr:hypothetical protein [Hungatella hathewayi]